ncbi:MAG TPA: carboxypeptidase-like regulatory domain-containing protein, partial [Bryobacteraceae bacterium]|nr:carboxypeptidase-like regulatory domain-containing protein [Bryobacteraceae bacterium]
MVRFLLLVLLGAAPLAAQSTFGTILGTVTDGSGAVIPGAKVVITNQGENTSRSTLADHQGNYEALNLKAGTYRVTAEATGFKSFEVEGLSLIARQTMRVNVTLEVGAVTETVRVDALAPVITTDTQTIAASFDSQQVLHLPVNYRGAGTTSPLRILSYQPGVQSDNGYNFSVQGALPGQTEVSLDGISTIDVSGNHPLTELFPSAESISEMKVQA